MLINIFSDVLGKSDIFLLNLKPLLKQYKLNWEQCSFFQLSERSHSMFMPADTRQLSYASKMTQAVVIPAFPPTILSDSFYYLAVLRA